eukprot:5636896-Amphidinium_carterae.1
MVASVYLYSRTTIFLTLKKHPVRLSTTGAQVVLALLVDACLSGCRAFTFAHEVCAHLGAVFGVRAALNRVIWLLRNESECAQRIALYGVCDTMDELTPSTWKSAVDGFNQICSPSGDGCSLSPFLYEDAGACTC